MANPVLQAILGRRSVFRFTADEIDPATIEQILEAGRWAPSYTNTQPWTFIVVTDPAVKRQLSQLGVRITLFSEGIQQAPVVIAVAVDPRKDPLHFVEDGSVATQNMAIAAHSLGLASYWVGVYDRTNGRRSAERAVKKLLNLPEAYRVIALLPIGVPAYEPHASRNRLRDLLHDNRYTATRDD